MNFSVFKNNETNKEIILNFYSSIHYDNDNNSVHNDDNESIHNEIISNDNESIQNDNNSIHNESIHNDDNEPLDEELLMISNIWNNSNSNKNSLIRDILNKSMINDIMDDNS